jgi:large conductance mechanosensitive channel
MSSARESAGKDFRSSSERRTNVLKEFKEFAIKGNVLDMAVGIIIGGAFGTIVKSLVSDVIMPPVGVLLGGVDFSNLFVVLGHGGPFDSLSAAQEAGAATLNYGLFINNCISFLIVAFAVFFLVRGFNAMRRKEEAAPAPAEPPAQEKLLAEIRDLLKQRA